MLTPEQVLVIVADCERDPRACNYDDIGAVLDQMQVAHTVVTKKDFEAGKADLRNAVSTLEQQRQLMPELARIEVAHLLVLAGNVRRGLGLRLQEAHERLRLRVEGRQ